MSFYNGSISGVFKNLFISTFLMDVFIGSLLGTIITTVTFLFLRDRLKSLKTYSLTKFLN